MQIEKVNNSKELETAKEMRDIANEKIQKESHSLASKLIERIKVEASQGRYKGDFLISGGLEEKAYLETQKILESLGYEVSGDTSPYVCRYWRIVW